MSMVISTSLKEGHAKTFPPLPDTTPQFSKRQSGYSFAFMNCEYIFQEVEKETHYYCVKITFPVFTLYPLKYPDFHRQQLGQVRFNRFTSFPILVQLFYHKDTLSG